MRWGRAIAVATGVLGISAVALVVASPALLTRVLAARGITAAKVAWDGDGLHLSDVRRGEAHVDAAVVGWDRVAHLSGVTVPLAEVEKGGHGGGAGFLAGIAVEGLTVPGTPLPVLSGTVSPTRHLTGENVVIDGDTVTLSVPTPYGTADVHAERHDGVVTLSARCAACTLSEPTLSESTLALPPVDFEGTYDDGALHGKVTAGAVSADVEATWRDGVATGTVHLPPTPVADVYGVLGSIVPEAGRARIAGTIAGEGTFTLPGGPIHFTPALEGLAVDGIVPAVYEGGSFTYWGHDAQGQRVLVNGGEGTPDWLPLDAIGRWLPAAVIATEDAAFPSHPGYDVREMLAAAGDNAEAGHVVRGGSTLTQQLAKNLFLDGDRTYARKLRELLYAVNMERRLGKRRILELYLNVVEWGPDIRGAKAAAQAYFLKQPGGLLPEEAAFLANILRNPRTAWRTQYLRGRPETTRIEWILDNMQGLSPEERADAKARAIHFVPP